MKAIYLKVTAFAGSDIVEACIDAALLARTLGIAVEFNFNGCQLIAHPNSRDELLVDRYQQWLRTANAPGAPEP